MGLRGPKPGAKKARANTLAATATVAAIVAAPVGDAVVSAHVQKVADVVQLSAADRENPEKLTGEPLRLLAHRRGLARSAVDAMDDAKIRRELRILTYRQYETA